MGVENAVETEWSSLNVDKETLSLIRKYCILQDISYKEFIHEFILNNKKMVRFLQWVEEWKKLEGGK